jgi:hypothetical protein
MATTIRISGVDIERQKGSLYINDGLERRSTASFVVVDRTGVANYVRGQAVDIFRGLAIPPFIHPLFSGFIDYPKRRRMSPTSTECYWTIKCIDNHYVADKRIAAESYTGQTAAFIVNDLFTKYLQPEGVTLGTVDTGPTIAEMIINYQSVAKALDVLAAKSNFVWSINVGKELNFAERDTEVAPFAIVETDIERETGILSDLAEAAPFYRNRQYIRAGKDITGPQVETRTGDGVAVAFAMGYPLNQVPTITLGGAPQTVELKGIGVAANWYWAKGDPIITAVVAPGVGVPVQCTYIGEYNIIVRADDLLAQAANKAVEGGTGLVEVMGDEPNINDRNDAFAIAVARLEYYGVIGKQFTFPIRQWGLQPGQIVTVTHTPYGLAADDLLVESVEVSEIAPNELRYMVTAVEGPLMGDWTGFFKMLADIKGEIMERVIVGPDLILILLTTTSETWEWSESITETVYACPLPGLAVFPSLTLYPC